MSSSRPKTHTRIIRFVPSLFSLLPLHTHTQLLSNSFLCVTRISACFCICTYFPISSQVHLSGFEFFLSLKIVSCVAHLVVLPTFTLPFLICSFFFFLALVGSSFAFRRFFYLFIQFFVCTICSSLALVCLPPFFLTWPCFVCQNCKSVFQLSLVMCSLLLLPPPPPLLRLLSHVFDLNSPSRTQITRMRHAVCLQFLTLFRFHPRP